MKKKLKKEFAIPENLNYYSDEDYKIAEKLFILYKQGRLNYEPDKRVEHIRFNRAKILILTTLTSLLYSYSYAGELMPDYKKNNEIFGVYRWSNAGDNYRTRVIQGVTHDYRNRKTLKWNYSTNYLICNNQKLELPFSVYDVIKRILYVDNFTDGCIDRIIHNPTISVYKNATK